MKVFLICRIARTRNKDVEAILTSDFGTAARTQHVQTANNDIQIRPYRLVSNLRLSGNQLVIPRCMLVSDTHAFKLANQSASM